MNTPETKYYIGIDGGGTKTKFLLGRLIEGYGEDGDNYVEGYDEGDGAVGDGNEDGGNYGEDEEYNEVNW